MPETAIKTAKRKKLKHAAVKFFRWFIGNAFFALLPFSLVFYINVLDLSYDTTNLTSKEFENLIKGGIVVFFFCSLMGSNAVDIWLDNEHIAIGRLFPKIKKHIRIGLFYIPILCMVALTTVYLFILFGDIQENYFQNLSWFTIAIDGISFVYCFTYKMYNFVKGGN